MRYAIVDENSNITNIISNSADITDVITNTGKAPNGMAKSIGTKYKVIAEKDGNSLLEVELLDVRWRADKSNSEMR